MLPQERLGLGEAAILDPQLRPLTRDGGQRLEVSERLYGTVNAADEGALRSTWEEFWE